MNAARTIACIAGVLIAAAAQAGEPRFEEVVLSDARDGAAKSTFAPATPKVFLTGRLRDVPGGAKVKCAWIAEKTKVAPPDSPIDATELTVPSGAKRAVFALNRPTKGWPSGAYRAELFIDGKPAGIQRFTIKP